MQDPKALQSIIQMLGGSDSQGLKDLQARARRGQMTFAATQYAMSSGCHCDGCAFLRKAVEEELEEARREAGIHGEGDHSVPGPGPTVPGAEPPPDAGGGDLPVRVAPSSDDISA